MGGVGSGRHWQFGADTTDDYRSIDIRWLKREGLLESGISRRITWSRGGEVTGSINVQSEPGRVILDYRQRDRGGEWQQERYPVYLDTWAASGIGSSALPVGAVAVSPFSTAGQSSRAVIATGWPTLLSGKSRGIELHGRRIASGTKWAGLVASLKVVIGASPGECTGAPMSSFARNTTPCQIAPWSGSWIT